MYKDEFERWLGHDLEDPDLMPELMRIRDNDDEIKDRFAVSLKFGTAGLRGTLGAGTNRMNIWVVRQATQGLANWVLTQGGTQTVAISYDSRLKSDLFAMEAAGVLAANGIKVRLFDELRPTPELSFAVIHYGCAAGLNVTASHNPKEYNGYKVYWSDGAQLPPQDLRGFARFRRVFRRNKAAIRGNIGQALPRSRNYKHRKIVSTSPDF